MLDLPIHEACFLFARMQFAGREPTDFERARAKESFFVGGGRPLPAWKSYIGRLLTLERDDFGDLPDVKQFAGASLDSFFGMMRMLTQLLSSGTGLPSG